MLNNKTKADLLNIVCNRIILIIKNTPMTMTYSILVSKYINGNIRIFNSRGTNKIQPNINVSNVGLGIGVCGGRGQVIGYLLVKLRCVHG